MGVCDWLSKKTRFFDLLKINKTKTKKNELSGRPRRKQANTKIEG